MESDSCITNIIQYICYFAHKYIPLRHDCEKEGSIGTDTQL